MKKSSTKNLDKSIIFVNYDFGVTLTGIEHSALKRAKLFIENLDLKPTIISLKNRPGQKEIFEKHCKKEKLIDPPYFINIYDYLQGITTSTPKQTFPHDHRFKNYTAHPVKGYKDIRYIDSNKNLFSYKVFDKETGNLSHINFFSKGKKICREKYHSCGLLSSRQTLDPTNSNVLQEIFFDTTGKPAFEKKIIKNDIYYLIFDNQGQINQHFLSEESFFSHALKKLISELPNNKVLLISDKNKFTYIPCIQAKKMLPEKKIKVAAAIHNTHYYGTIPSSNLKSIYRSIFKPETEPDAIITLTKKQSEHLKKIINKKLLKTIPHSQNADKTTSKSREKSMIVYFARLAPEKQHLEALDIFAEVIKEHPNASLHFYGEGPERTKIEAAIESLQLQNNVHLHGYIENTHDILRQATCTILTTRMEGFSLALLESSACGCPMISYDINYGPQTIIKEGINGFLIKPGEKHKFAECISNIISGKVRFSEEQIIAHHEQRFSAKAVANKWADLLESL